ncbi:methyltransferase-like protein 27 [Mercenaria mercenaria]|uniref:methyltransferase-like protein 27 n=1 Tax=Mercenaria mercenaria TaxID=6596 RepID=UPI001E1E1ABE|nr:methyltransferase-like protein 27 [Mercenaria mercenaria]
MTGKNVKTWINEISADGVTVQQSQNAYIKWADKYDEDLEKHAFTGPGKVAQIVRDQILNQPVGDVRILDVAAGTGLVARELKKFGFRHIDALEPSEAMLKEAKKAHLYINYFVEFISESQTTIAESSYDVVTGSGLFANEAHVPCEALYEMIRVVKPGGLIVLCGRNHLLNDSETYKRLEPLMDKLESDKKWKKVLREIWPGYLKGIDGVAWCYQVL